MLSAVASAFVAAFGLAGVGRAAVPDGKSPARLPAIAANDNTVAAGGVVRGTLRLALVARRGLWYPDGPRAIGLPIEAFGVAGEPLRIPGPLLRAPLGTRVVATVRNDLGHDLTIRGLAAPADAPTAVLRIPRGRTRRVSFVLDRPGTFGYYGSDRGETIDARAFDDAELSGAIVVDAPHRPRVDHVFVLGLYAPITFKDGSPNFLYLLETINGRAYPATERLSYERGRRVRWAVYNASSMLHPMHLHGFYFRVDRPDAYDEVTHPFYPGASEELAWTADRPGDWMFHCHITDHTSRHAPLRIMLARKADPHFDVPARFHQPDGAMSGMVVAVRVRPRPGDARPALAAAPRELALDVRSQRVANARFGLSRDSYTLTDGATTMPPNGSLGPTIVLTQGEPVAIAVTNHMDEATSVHWHGIALDDSYYDGGAGMGMSAGMGAVSRMSPPIEPGATFVARFAPPDAGTFTYHSHLDDGWQLAGGLVGPLVVVPRGERFDPATDHVVMISEAVETAGGPPLAIDGSLAPKPIAATAGVPQRLRFADLTIGGQDLVVSLYDGDRAMTWTPVAKDGRAVPAALQRPGIAIHALTIGETRDFRFTPTHAGVLTLTVRDATNGGALAATQTFAVANP